jgi:hypothetical protein
MLAKQLHAQCVFAYLEVDVLHSPHNKTVQRVLREV